MDDDATPDHAAIVADRALSSACVRRPGRTRRRTRRSLPERPYRPGCEVQELLVELGEVLRLGAEVVVERDHGSELLLEQLDVLLRTTWAALDVARAGQDERRDPLAEQLADVLLVAPQDRRLCSWRRWRSEPRERLEEVESCPARVRSWPSRSCLPAGRRAAARLRPSGDLAGRSRRKTRSRRRTRRPRRAAPPRRPRPIRRRPRAQRPRGGRPRSSRA